MITEEQVNALKKAVELAGSLERLRLTYAQYLEFLHAVAWYTGGPLESVDAFVTQVPGTVIQMSGSTNAPLEEHRVFWLRGNLIGSLAIGAHQGAEGAAEPAVLSGYVRSISDVKRLDLRDIEFQWSPVDQHHPDVRPAVRIPFDDLAIPVGLADRPNQPARDQAATFIARLQTAFAEVER